LKKLTNSQRLSSLEILLTTLVILLQASPIEHKVRMRHRENLSNKSLRFNQVRWESLQSRSSSTKPKFKTCVLISKNLNTENSLHKNNPLSFIRLKTIEIKVLTAASKRNLSKMKVASWVLYGPTPIGWAPPRFT